jgi:hypothetical protein
LKLRPLLGARPPNKFAKISACFKCPNPVAADVRRLRLSGKSDSGKENQSLLTSAATILRQALKLRPLLGARPPNKFAKIRACFKCPNPVAAEVRRLKLSGRSDSGKEDQSLLTSAATILEHALTKTGRTREVVR